jgi:hypothetical protein
MRNTPLRLSDLRRAHAADATLENLLRTLTEKMQACSTLTVFEYEAGNDGHEALATAFRQVAATERESFTLLLEHLRRHLNELPAQPRIDAGYQASPSAGDR